MIYIDFDGTLVDLWSRYYEVFCHLSDADGLSLEDYRYVKRRYKKDENVAKVLGCSLKQDYFALKRQLLEEMDYLMLDKLYMPAEYLNNFPKEKCMILTKRRNKENFEKQLELLGIDLPYSVISSDDSKIEWIRTNNVVPSGVIIGDSLMDLEVGKLNITPYMVETGLNTKEDFAESKIEYRCFKNINSIDFDRLFNGEI